MHKCREAIVKSCWLAGIFTLGCLVFGSLWRGLFTLGDVQGASVTRGIFWGFAICWGMNGAALIGLLTATTLRPAPAAKVQRTTDN